MEQIKLFLFVLSLIYSLRFVSEFVIKLAQESPEPMSVSKVEQTFLYFSVAYIITFFLI